VLRADPREYRRARHQLRQLVVGEGSKLLAGDDALGPVGPVDAGDAQVPGDRPGGLGVVAGDHLHLDPGPLAGGNRLGGFRPGRVDHPLEAQEDQAVSDIVVPDGSRFRRQRLPGQRQHAQALGCQLVRLAAYLRLIDRSLVARRQQPGLAFRQDRFHRALQVSHRRSSLARRVEGGHVLMLGLEGNRVDPGEGGVFVLLLQATLEGRDQERSLGRVALHLPEAVLVNQPRIVAQKSSTQALVQGDRPVNPRRGALADLARRLVSGPARLVMQPACRDLLYGHLVLGEGAGLVGTDDRHAAQGFHGGKPADDGVSPGHARHADRQHDRHGGGQALRNRPDGQSHRDLERVQPVLAAQDVDGEGGRRQGENHHQEVMAELLDLLCERRVEDLGRGDHLRDLPDLGAIAGGDHDAGPGSEGDEGRAVGHVPAVGQARLLRYDLVGLLRRHGLAGERGFVDLEIARARQSQVGRHLVARLQEHDVSGHERNGREPRLLSTADDGGLAGNRLGQRGDGPQGLGFLNEAHEGIDQDDPENDGCVDPFLEQAGHERGRKKDVDQRLMELEQETDQRPLLALLGDDIRSEVLMPRLDREAVQPALLVAFQQLEDFFAGEVVPMVAEERLHVPYLCLPIVARMGSPGGASARHSSIAGIVAACTAAGKGCAAVGARCRDWKAAFPCANVGIHENREPSRERLSLARGVRWR